MFQRLRKFIFQIFINAFWVEMKVEKLKKKTHFQNYKKKFKISKIIKIKIGRKIFENL